MPTVTIDSLTLRDDINCRATDRTAGIEALAASILAHGLLNPIQVRPAGDGRYEVVDGNRRTTAIKLLRSRGQWAADVDVIDLGTMNDSDARELSLAANIIREDIHPIDEFEAFAKLAVTMKVAEIAEHFGKTEKEVRQRLALGELHSDLRALWRAGDINDDSAKAFTLCKDQSVQIEVYNRLKSENRALWAHNIRNALGMDYDANQALEVIGVEAYEAAGGTVTEDLFGDGEVLSDPDLAKRLLAEKLQKVCADLVEDGWGFAKPRSEVQNPWGWAKITPTGKRQPTEDEQAELDDLRPKIEILEEEDEDEDGLTEERQAELEALQARVSKIEDAIDARRWGARQKKRAGCFVYIDGSDIAIDYGRIDPKAKQPVTKDQKGAKDDEGKDEATAPEPQEERISVALNLALSEQLTKAAYDVLCADHGIALAVAVAALETAYGTTPARIRSDGAPCVAHRRDDAAEFPTILSEALGIRASSEIDKRLAAAVAQSLDLRNMVGGGQTDGALALLRALDGPQLDEACRKHFDAEHYFKGVKAELCNAALDEMGIDQKGRPKKKGELAELCAKAAEERGWLPPQMRQWKISEDE